MTETFEEALGPALIGGCSLFHVETTDLLALEDRVLEVCGQRGYSLFRWGPITGIECVYYTERVQKGSDGKWMSEPSIQASFNKDDKNKNCDAIDLVSRMVTDPVAESDKTETLIPSKSVIIAEFLDKYMNNPALLQSIVDGIAFNLFGSRRVRLIVAAPSLNIDSQVLKYSMPLSLDLPTEDEIEKITIAVMDLATSISKDKVREAEQLKDTEVLERYKNNWFRDKSNAVELIPHLKGLTAFRVKRAVYQAVTKYPDKGIDTVIQYISAYKMQVVENSKVLRFLPYNEQEDEHSIGGFDNLLEFIKLRKNAFSEEARKQNLDTPKGVVLLGRPGTGKSLAAKAMGRMLGNLPVVVMDVGSLFGSLVGESEARVREALSIIDGINGCVLLIDEADKAFAGNNSGTSGDSGTSQRVLGSVLNWLNDHKSKTFVVLTLNRIDTLPPELLRAGRFDKTFYTDLPTSNERKTIMEIHLRKRLEPINQAVDFTEDEWLDILTETSGYVGAEIEEVVKDARLQAFNNTGSAIPTAKDILDCCKSRTPMSQSDAISSETMKACKKIAEPVSKRPYKVEIDED